MEESLCILWRTLLRCLFWRPTLIAYKHWFVWKTNTRADQHYPESLFIKSSSDFRKSKESTIPGVLLSWTASILWKRTTYHTQRLISRIPASTKHSHTHSILLTRQQFIFSESVSDLCHKIYAWAMMETHKKTSRFQAIFMPGQSLLEWDSLLYPAAYTYKSRQKLGTQYGPWIAIVEKRKNG